MIKVVPKIIRLLELFSTGNELIFSDIVSQSELNRSNVSHLLNSLCLCGILEQTSHGCYRRGERLIQLCGDSNPRHHLLKIAERTASEALAKFNELVVVSIRADDRRITLVRLHPRKTLQVNDESVPVYPATWYATANGRILLAYTPREKISDIVRRHGLPAASIWPQAQTLPKLLKELEVIRNRGCVSFMVDKDVKVIGVPVYDGNDEPLIGLSLAFPHFSCHFSEQEIVNYLHFIGETMHQELKIHDLRIKELKF